MKSIKNALKQGISLKAVNYIMLAAAVLVSCNRTICVMTYNVGAFRGMVSSLLLPV